MGLAAAAPAAAESLETPSCEKGQAAPFRFETPHFAIECSVPAATGRRYAVLCERAYEKLRGKFHVTDDATVWDGRCRVLFFARRDQLADFATRVHNSLSAAQSTGYARITKNDPDIVLSLHDGDHVRLQQVLVHEMTHVFLQLFHSDEPIAPWLHEGFAQYFEFQVNPPKSRLGAMKRRAKELAKSGGAKPLAKLWAMETIEANDIDTYAQCYSLVDMMVTKGSAKRTGDFVLALKNGADTETALAESFSCTPDKLEALWKRYVLAAY